MDRHKPVERLEELLALDNDEVINGYCSTEPGDPEPGINHSRAFHHGWRMKMMDLREIECPLVHQSLVHAFIKWNRNHRDDAKRRCTLKENHHD